MVRNNFRYFTSCTHSRCSKLVMGGPSFFATKSQDAHPKRMPKNQVTPAVGDQAANQKHASTADWLLVATPGVIWGASFLFIAEGLRAIAPNGVSFIRIAIGFATLSFFS